MTRTDPCTHGLLGFCPDCAPQRHVVGTVRGVRAAEARGRTVWRYRENGSLDWVTNHWTKRGARRAARLYEQTGKVKGLRP